MKKTTKKIVALSLALTMALSLTGCADKKTTTKSDDVKDATVTEAAAGTDTAEATPTTEPLDDVTLSLYMGESALMTGGIQTDPIAQLIKEKTGVTLDITIADNDKTQAMVASGDLYDINILGSTDYIEPLIKSGAIQPMDDYLQYIPEVTENFPTLMEYCKKYLSAGTDKTYVLAERPGDINVEPAVAYGDHSGAFVRWDYYKEVGCPVPASVDEWLDMLAAIQKNHPTTENGKQVYGLAQFVDWGEWGLTEYSVISKAKGILSCGQLQSFGLSDLSFYDLYNDNNLWWQTANLDWKANQRGLLDPESFAQNHDTIAQKLTEGRILTSPAHWEVKGLPVEDNQKFIDVPFADTAEFPEMTKVLAPFGYKERMIFLSSSMDEKKMKAAMRLINWLYSEDGSRTIMIGLEGVTWTKDANGVAKFTDAALEGLKNSVDNSYEDSQNFYKYINIIGLDYGSLAKNGQPLDLRKETEYVKQSLSTAEKEYSAQFGQTVPADVMAVRQNNSTNNKGYLSLMSTDIPTEVSRINTSVLNYMMQEIPNLVNTKTQEEYDAKVAAMREEIKNMGYDTVSEFYKQSFETAKTEYTTLSGK